MPDARQPARPARRPVPVLALMDITLHYFREVMRGVRAYVPAGPRWDVDFQMSLAPMSFRAMVRQSGCRGVILSLPNDTWQRSAAPLNVPVVSVSDSCHRLLVPRVVPDNYRVGVLAAEHLLERGFRSFAFVGGEGRFSLLRRKGFVDTVSSAGCPCHCRGFSGPVAARLAKLPMPLGVLVAEDLEAARLIETCRDAGLSVPEQIGILGVDNTDLYCDTCRPRLSSVDTAGRLVGYEAARVLDGLMHGAPPPPEVVLIPPAGVVTRGSTDTVAVADPRVAGAIRFIRDHACEAILVDDVVRAVNVSRRTLEKRFAAVLGRTIRQEILHAQLTQVRRLLAETDLPVSEVGFRCGFGYPKRFSATFREAFGLPPSAYRRQFRLR